MLVLSRKSQERIIIGEGIEVTVLGISGNRVRLGIKAPPDVPILRNELERRILGVPNSREVSEVA